MEINNKVLKPYESIFIIAEIASSHEGRVELAKKMTDAVVYAKADAVKFQMFNAESLLVPQHHKTPSFKQIQFSESEWREIIDYSKRLGLYVIAEVFDDASFELAEDIGIGLYKIPTSDLTNPFLLKKVCSTMKTLILSVGAATKEEIDYAVKICRESGNENIILMHGFQNFPTKIEDTNFRLLEYLESRYPYLIGFADHIDAEGDLALVLPSVAVGYGAAVIEKHITLDRSLKGRDHYSALNPDEFLEMVGLIRKIEKSHGASEIGCSDAEAVYRKLMKKKIIAVHDIPEGKLITLDDICFRRTDQEGLVPNQYVDILKKAKTFIPQYSVITKENVC